MSSTAVVGIVVAIAVIVVVVLVLRKRAASVGEGEKTPPPIETKPAPAAPAEEAPEPAADEKPEPQPIGEPEAEETAAEQVPVAVPAAVDEEPAEALEPTAPAPAEREPTSPGVKLDEKAEQEEAAKVKEARRERRLKRLRKGLAPTRGGFIAKIGALFKGKKEIDENLIEELEEALITADVGVKTAEWFINLIREALDKQELKDASKVWDLLRDEVARVLAVDAPPMNVEACKPYTIMVVGVNGVGKTTTIGKLAAKFTDQGKKVVLAAADTFRAAAVNQLEVWGKRSGADVIKSKEGADPSSVVFDAIKHGKEVGADIVIADTAGRLHTKTPLMEELKKTGRVMGKALDGAPHQSLLVLDATTGQNAIQQVAMFNETLELDGIVLTKLDGTAKGGVIIGVCHEHNLPVRFIGIGEAKDDLREFEAADFVDALFLREDEVNDD